MRFSFLGLIALATARVISTFGLLGLNALATASHIKVCLVKAYLVSNSLTWVISRFVFWALNASATAWVISRFVLFRA